MKVLSRDFTVKEKVLLCILFIMILAFAYYQFIDQPVRESIDKANAEKQELELELTSVKTKIVQLEEMKQEIDQIEKDKSIKPMPSYNNIANINALFNKVLADDPYSIEYGDIVRNGDQVRREVILEFVPKNFADLISIYASLEGSDYRCLVDGISYRRVYDRFGNYSLTARATLYFYETMVGGTPDAGLPADKADANQVET